MKSLEKIIRHIFGYFFGFAMFVLAIPYGLYFISIKTKDATQLLIPENNYITIIISLLLLILGIIFIIWSNLYLFVKGKGGPTDVLGVTISPRTKHLVTEGPYRYTRNPMVFGTLSCYFAFAIYLNSIISIGVLLLFVCIIVLYLKNTEEKRLLNDFGDEFIEFKKQVSMIFPWPKK